MKLLIKQRVFSWTDTYDVYDEYGNPKYFVKGEFLSIGHKIHIYRHDTGEEVGMVREKLMTVMPRFELIAGGRALGSIQKRFALFKPKYVIDYACQDDELIGLLTVIAIDAANCSDGNR